MKRDYVSSCDELFANKGTIKSIIDSDISLLERQLKEDTKKNPNNKSSNSATLKAVKKYKKHFNKFVDDEFDIKSQDPQVTKLDYATYRMPKTPWYQDSSILGILLYAFGVAVGIFIGVMACRSDMHTYYQYTDINGETGYASTCSGDECRSGNKTIKVQHFEAIKEQ